MPGANLAHSTIDRAWIDEQFAADPVSANAGFGGNFRTDVEAFVTLEAIDACLSAGVLERAPLSDVRYFAFVDPSGGSADSMTLAISHTEDNVSVLDAIREVKPPFSPEAVVEEFTALLRTYRIGSVRADRYAGEWPRECGCWRSCLGCVPAAGNSIAMPVFIEGPARHNPFPVGPNPFADGGNADQARLTVIGVAKVLASGDFERWLRRRHSKPRAYARARQLCSVQSRQDCDAA